MNAEKINGYNMEVENFTPPNDLNTPVLFLVFNRLATTVQVFEEIRKAKPPRLYIASDGARTNVSGELEKVLEIRNYLLSKIDWDCKVNTLFRDNNLGCKYAVSSAIDWFFKNEEMGIILEDDCLPSQSFFWYCQDLLIKFKNDNRIAQISGSNLVNYKNFEDSYLFAKNKTIWGWATWRRSWENIDLEMTWYQSSYKFSIIKNMGYTKRSYNFWLHTIKLINQNKVNTWDWPWFFSIAAQGQYNIFPKSNLVSNIGFGNEASHTLGSPKEEYILKYNLIFPLKHPIYFSPDTEYDELYENLEIIPRIPVSIFIRIFRRLLKLLK